MTRDARVLSVSALTGSIKALLEDTFGAVTVEGEISNYRPSGAGHVYFTLKDEGAAISAVMFRGKARFVNFTPADGMLVRVTGSVSVYAQRGNYQIIVDTMERAGEGAILAMLEERKKRLQAEGLFDPARKRTLPFFPHRIGVVTSPTGAALRDILQIARRRNPGIGIVVLPCLVQGIDAPAQICAQIRAANAWGLCDVLIVGRGGGSLEDLLPFSEESVVRAVAASAIPVVSAVGHEIDWALSDFAADVRAPTPSGAAELAAPQREAIASRVFYLRESLSGAIQARVERFRLSIRVFTPESLEIAFRNIEQPLLSAFDDAKVALLGNMRALTDSLRRRVERASQSLEGANPRAILARGYAFVRNASTNRIIRAASETRSGDVLEITPAEGIIKAAVV
ncbi:MAG: exodeoxyribonuclease VII large subunit [Spirochaetaceae bacterium]|jgi:exodeoxyribonuclease VII large subunit|nr:exodeoxyribonuclease VII large subunit [Spirochaetaceae bacterium]